MKISIIGCGWLGLPLGKVLVAAGHSVSGSTRSIDKFPSIEAAGIQPYQFSLEPMPTGSEFNELFQTDLLFINIPPGTKRNPPSFYEEQVKYLTYLADQHQVSRIIFISSTSYYPQTNDWVDERTPYDLSKGSKEAVVQGEKQIRKANAQTLIFRCAGLMGGNRIAGRWFAGKPTKGADTPVNYIHRDDLIQIISKAIEAAEWPQPVVNLVCPEHPRRRDVHSAMAQKYGFEVPIWTKPSLNEHKLIRSLYLEHEFLFPSPLEF